MRKQIVAIALLLMTGFSFGQNTSDAVEYMDYFSEEYEIIQKDMWDYTKSVSHGRSARKVEKRRSQLIKSVDAALKKAQSAKPFGSDTEYRDAVVHYFDLISIVLKEDYAKIVDMEAVAEQSYDAMEAYMMARDLANDKQADASKELNAKQKVFAEANNINLIESKDELDQKLEIAGEVYDHYNEVYLIFFKSNKQEMYLMDAIGRGDVNGIEQNREALKSTVEEGKEKLKEVEAYKGDKSMMNATQELFEFYEREAKEMDVAIDYFLKAENFQKIKTAFEQKKERNRTQKDIDQYNNAVNEMNDAVNAYNKQNDANNTVRSKLVENWNNSAEKFTSKHVPK